MGTGRAKEHFGVAGIVESKPEAISMPGGKRAAITIRGKQYMVWGDLAIVVSMLLDEGDEVSLEGIIEGGGTALRATRLLNYSHKSTL